GAAPLEGLIETDWAVATFTMNWKLTRPKHPVTFARGEPICMLVPQRRGELESFQPEIRELAAEPELKDAYTAWRDGRQAFLLAKLLAGPGPHSAGSHSWQGEYFRGTAPDGTTAPDHHTKLHLRSFQAIESPLPAPPA